MGETTGPDADLTTRASEAKLSSRFLFKKSLGVGGMGEVYLAEDSSLRRPVAIKTVRPDLARDPEIRRRIERECLLHAKVGPHPHIVTLFDKLEEGDRLNLVMEYVEGETLQQMLEHHHKAGTIPPLNQAVVIAVQVLDALSRIHAHGIVHRDIKPANIILTKDDAGAICAKLMDFGIARGQDDEFASRLTQESGSGPGTPLYMAPEQIDPQTFGGISPATDVYAMGVMLYQMTSGEPPFTGSITQIFNGHLRSAPPSLGERARGRVPASLVEVIECALAKNPASRFQTAKALRDELMRIGPGGAAAAPSPGVTLPSRSGAAENPAMTLRANEALFTAAAGSTQLTGSKRSSASVRRGRSLTKWIAVAIVFAALGALALFVLPGLLKGKDGEKQPAAEKPVASGQPASGAGEAAAPEASAPDAATAAAPVPPAAEPAGQAPATPAAAPSGPPNGDLPLGFGASPAPHAPAPVPAPAAQSKPDSAVSAADIVSSGLAARPAEAPAAPTPEPSIAVTVTKAQEPAKTEKPKAVEPAKTETKTEKPSEQPKAAEPAPADSGNAWKADSVEAHKVN